jgi:hypothetical protein
MKVFLSPRLTSSKGGPSSFQSHLIRYLSANQVSYTFDISRGINAALVINGTKNICHLLSLWLARVPITIRLGSKYRSNLFESCDLRSRTSYLPRYLLILTALLLSKYVIFQSNTVRDEWSSNPLLRFKKTFVIYNPSERFRELSSSSYSQASTSANTPSPINLIALEANHPSALNSFPISVFSYLKKLGYDIDLHVFGIIPPSWGEIVSREFPRIKVYGFLERSTMLNSVELLNKPIYLPSDIFPCGCPNSMIDMLSLGVPVITYDDTAGAELVYLCGGGLTLPGFKRSMTRLSFPSLDLIQGIINLIFHNYSSFSSSAKTINTHLSPDCILSRYLSILSESCD